MSDNHLPLLILAAAVAGVVACDSGTEPAGPQPAVVELEAPVDVLPVGQDATLEVTVRDEAGEIIPDADVEFVSSTQSLASVSDAGVVTGIGEGDATITATAGTVSDITSIFVFDADLCASGLGLVADEPVRASLQEGDCVEVFEDGSFVDFWYFELDDEAEITIDMTSDELDAYLFVFDDTDVLAEDDDSGSGSDARIVVTLDAGLYWVGAATWPDDSGNYTIELTTDATATAAAPVLRSARTAVTGPRTMPAPPAPQRRAHR